MYLFSISVLLNNLENSQLNSTPRKLFSNTSKIHVFKKIVYLVFEMLLGI